MRNQRCEFSEAKSALRNHKCEISDGQSMVAIVAQARAFLPGDGQCAMPLCGPHADRRMRASQGMFADCVGGDSLRTNHSTILVKETPSSKPSDAQNCDKSVRKGERRKTAR
jgi:hypothetical protein